MLKNIALTFIVILLCLLIGSYWFFASPVAFAAGVWG